MPKCYGRTSGCWNEQSLRRQFAGEAHRHDIEQLIWIYGFEKQRWKIAVGQALDRFLDLIGRQAGKQDDREILVGLLKIIQDAKAIGARHLQIEQQQVGQLLLEKQNGRLAVVGFIDLI